jgi:hypothetical protein
MSFILKNISGDIILFSFCSTIDILWIYVHPDFTLSELIETDTIVNVYPDFTLSELIDTDTIVYPDFTH